MKGQNKFLHGIVANAPNRENDVRQKMSIRTEITKGEGAATGFRSLLSSIFLFFLACGIGVVLGESLTYRMLDISAANPLTWGSYIIAAGGSILGLIFFFLTPSLLLLFVFSAINTYALFIITVLTQVLMVLIVNEELNIPLFCLAIAAWFAWQASRYYRKRKREMIEQTSGGDGLKPAPQK